MNFYVNRGEGEEGGGLLKEGYLNLLKNWTYTIEYMF